MKSMLGIMEKRLEYKNIPYGYELCFNENCQLRDKCMHYQAYLLKPDERQVGPTVYPSAWKSGTCLRFNEVKLVQKAWGFSQLYKNVPHYQRAEARRSVMRYFSNGKGPYYRYHHGENKLTPIQQDAIMNILSKFGSTEGLAFDHYETDFDFS